MDRKRRTAASTLQCLAGLVLAVLAAAAPVRVAAAELSTAEQLAEDTRAAPCDDRERLEAVRALFLAAGAQPEEIHVDDYGKVRNVRVDKPGPSPETIVVGAHFDKVNAGCGVVDNWSGVVALVHIYRTLRPLPLGKSFVFVAFGREEEGLMGSKAMARAIPSGRLAHHCAMVNIDSLGLSWPQAGRNMSSRKLTDHADDLARRMNIQFDQAVVAGNSDSSSFIDRGIPALTLHGLSRNFRKIIHTQNDQPAQLRPQSLYLGYRLALGLVAEIDREACDAWR